MTPKTALALDGPMNGQYITPEEAEHYGYELCDWTWEGLEKIYVQTAYLSEDFNTDKPAGL